MDFCQKTSNCIRSRLAASEPFGKFHPFVKIFFSYTEIKYLILLVFESKIDDERTYLGYKSQKSIRNTPFDTKEAGLTFHIFSEKHSFQQAKSSIKILSLQTAEKAMENLRFCIKECYLTLQNWSERQVFHQAKS